MSRLKQRQTSHMVLLAAEGTVSSRTESHDAVAAILAVTCGTPDGKDTPGEDDTSDDDV